MSNQSNTLTRIKSKNNYLVGTLNPNAPFRLFCFPYAGAGASAYNQWSRELSNVFEVFSIQLPGRENRIMEKPHTSMEELIACLAEDFHPYMDERTVFFGHSMGALIAFELTRYISNHYDKKPLHLFLSGTRHPDEQSFTRTIHDLPREEFIEELKRRNGTPEEFFENTELIDLILPYVRADFQICETYNYEVAQPINVPISSLSGDSDPFINKQFLEKWREETTSNFESVLFKGDHFYLHGEDKDKLKEYIKNTVTNLR